MTRASYKSLDTPDLYTKGVVSKDITLSESMMVVM